MSSNKCAVCNKTAYPLESVTALEKQYHKACFKCVTCKQSLNLKNFKGYEGKIYCFTHTPKPSATTVTDSVAVRNALAAPKKTSEGLGNVQKGIGGKPSIQVFGADGSSASAGGDDAGASYPTTSTSDDYSGGGGGGGDYQSYEDAPPADDSYQQETDEYGGEQE